jgi:carbonic anhydrase
MPAVDPQRALHELVLGNRRYAGGKPAHPRQGADRRREVAPHQAPLAVILSCSDSRVPPEILFDCGLGDLFVVRTAGHVVDSVALGSLEYAVEHLGVPLIVVLGHSRCGAVTAALESTSPQGHISTLVSALRATIASAQGEPGDAVDNAVRANIRQTVSRLQASSLLLSEPGSAGTLRIVGAYYDLDTGDVTFLS